MRHVVLQLITLAFSFAISVDSLPRFLLNKAEIRTTTSTREQIRRFSFFSCVIARDSEREETILTKALAQLRLFVDEDLGGDDVAERQKRRDQVSIAKLLR